MRLDFESGADHTALPNDGLQRPNFEFCMIRNWHGHCAEVSPALHHNMASSLANHLKTVLLENAADVSSGKDPELTHVLLQSG